MYDIIYYCRCMVYFLSIILMIDKDKYDDKQHSMNTHKELQIWTSLFDFVWSKNISRGNYELIIIYIKVLL